MPKNTDKIKIYLIARIAIDAHNWNNHVTSHLDKEKILVFKPQEHNPYNELPETYCHEVFQADLDAIRDSDIGLCLPEFGSDCAWECGWYSNSPKPLVIFIHDQTGWLKDWMVKGGVDYVVTDLPETYAMVKSDPILSKKQVILLEDVAKLTDILQNIHAAGRQSVPCPA